MHLSPAPIDRRSFLLGAAALGAASLVRVSSARADDQPEVLRPAAGMARLGPSPDVETSVWNYNNAIPGPAIRIPKGKPARFVVDNALGEDTTIHWHGIRLPNAMDGVPGLTQSPIRPGEQFVYKFTPPDAGTFWYHPHTDSLQQLGRGLAGPLIVEEAEPVAVDRDLAWMLQDWRLDATHQLAAGFGSQMDAVMSGRVGNVVTLNGSVPADQTVRAGERIRLRLINAALARIVRLHFEGHRPVVIAVDGQPCDPFEATGGIVLGPAMRIDLVIDMQGDPGQRFAVTDDYYDGLAYRLTSLVYAPDQPLRAHPLDATVRLPRNPVPEPDLTGATTLDLHLQGGMAGGGAFAGLGGLGQQTTPGMNGGPAWAINGMSMTGDGQMKMDTVATFERGQSVVLTMRNETAWTHPMHVHGFSFTMLTRNGLAVPDRQLADTVLLAPRDVVECAFVADNPGDWMLHCHVADHQMTGLMTVFRVT